MVVTQRKLRALLSILAPADAVPVPSDPGEASLDRLWLQLWNCLQPDVMCLAQRFRRYARRAGLEPEDLVQSGFLVLEHAVERFDPSRGVPFPVFFQTCLRNLFVSLGRRPAEMTCGDLDVQLIQDKRRRHEDGLAEVLLRDQLDVLLQHDPLRQRKLEIFKQRWLGGWTLTEIARREGKSVGTLSKWAAAVEEELWQRRAA